MSKSTTLHIFRQPGVGSHHVLLDKSGGVLKYAPNSPPVLSHGGELQPRTL